MDEHGPIWDHDPCSGHTLRRPDSTVRYPWHKWQAGDQGDDMDVWMAIELNADLLD